MGWLPVPTSTTCSAARQQPTCRHPARRPTPARSRRLRPRPPPKRRPPLRRQAAALVATITPVTIEPGPDTGTAVNKTIQTLRGQVSGLEGKLAANAQRLSDLRSAGAQAAGAYQEAKAHITTRLQVGTTKGNPELVSEWNTAQASLDALSGQYQCPQCAWAPMSTNDSSTAHFALDQIGATFNVSGAVDEDHRQLSLLEDETSQTIVMIDRLLSEVSDAVQRQTAYVANERAGLTVLASAIKNGELLWRHARRHRRRGQRRDAAFLRRHAAGGGALRPSQCGLSADSLCRAESGAAEHGPMPASKWWRFRPPAAMPPRCRSPRPRPAAMRKK